MQFPLDSDKSVRLVRIPQRETFTTPTQTHRTGKMEYQREIVKRARELAPKSSASPIGDLLSDTVGHFGRVDPDSGAMGNEEGQAGAREILLKP